MVSLTNDVASDLRCGIYFPLPNVQVETGRNPLPHPKPKSVISLAEWSGCRDLTAQSEAILAEVTTLI